MKRDNSYYREQRRKHIARKKKILKELKFYYGVKYDGELSKGKIHCSCGMCRNKTNNKGKHRLIHGNYAPSKNWKHSDLQKIENMDAAAVAYRADELD
jgi:hypothetical protein